MPERKTATKRVPSEEVQGSDSYILLRTYTMEESHAASKRAELRNARQRAFERDLKRATADPDLVPPEPPEDDAYDDGTALMATHILEWNWVDDTGNPLPQPSVDPSVIGLLNGEEVAFINRALLGPMGQDAKN